MEKSETQKRLSLVSSCWWGLDSIKRIEDVYCKMFQNPAVEPVEGVPMGWPFWGMG